MEQQLHLNPQWLARRSTAHPASPPRRVRLSEQTRTTGRKGIARARRELERARKAA